METIARRFLDLFGGKTAVKRSVDLGPPDQNGKVRPALVYNWKGAPTLELWKSHLKGECGLGTIGEGLYGVIDVDIYDLNVAVVIEAIWRLKLPLIPVRSKSDGLHLYLFCKVITDPQIIRRVLLMFCKMLGLEMKKNDGPGCEILINQNVWMPYVGGDRCCALKRSGLEMTVIEFLTVAEEARQSPEALELLLHKESARERKEGHGDPEWAHHHMTMQIKKLAEAAEGSRNTTLNKVAFDLGQLVARNWLSREEIETAMRGVFCEWDETGKSEGTMERGINAGLNHPHPGPGMWEGGKKVFPVFKEVVIVKDEICTWRVTIDHPDTNETLMMDLPAKTIADQNQFRVAWFERHHFLYDTMKYRQWIEMIRETAANATLTLREEPLTRQGEFKEILVDFTNGRLAQRREEIPMGLPFLNEDEKRYEFLLKTLIRAVVNERQFDYRGRADIGRLIRELGGDRQETRIKGRNVNVWWVPQVAVDRFYVVPEPPPVSGSGI